MSTNEQRPVFLIVDDSSDDRMFARTAFERANIDAELRMVDDGEMALEYLRREGEFADHASSPRPAVVLLDLRMHAMDGYEVLEKVNRDPTLNRIPIVVFTTSNSPDDIDRCYALGCNSYLVKPSHIETMVEAVRDLYNYWCELVELPP